MKKYSMSSKQIISWIFINYGLFILAFFSLGFMSNIKSVVVINFVLERLTNRAETKVGLSDPAVLSGKAVA